MKNALALAAALYIAITVSGTIQAAESSDQYGNPPPQSAQPPNDSVKQGIKNDAAAVKKSVKSGATEVKHQVAVAQCNDGEYSYTHHLTCNHHGGVKHQFH